MRVAVAVRVAVRAVPTQQRRGNVATEKDRTGLHGVSVLVICLSVVRTLGTERCELSSLAIAVVGPEDGSQVVAASYELSIERVAFASVPHAFLRRHAFPCSPHLDPLCPTIKSLVLFCDRRISFARSVSEALYSAGQSVVNQAITRVSLVFKSVYANPTWSTHTNSEPPQNRQSNLLSSSEYFGLYSKQCVPTHRACLYTCTAAPTRSATFLRMFSKYRL